MASGTPSITIPLGSDLLKAMGDIKGAAKAMGDEARSAKTDAKSAQNELKKVEREAKKANDAITKIKGKGGTVTQDQKTEAARLNKAVEDASSSAFEKAKISSEKEIKVQAQKAMLKTRQDFEKAKISSGKEIKVQAQKAMLKTRRDNANNMTSYEKEIKVQAQKAMLKTRRDNAKNMTSYERRVNGKILGVRDTLQTIGMRLQTSSIPALKNAGKSIGSAAGSLTEESISSAVSIGGQALRFAGIGAAGIAGGLAVAGTARKFIRRNMQEDIIRGETSDMITSIMRDFAGKSVTANEVESINKKLNAQEEASRNQATQENILGMFVGSKGTVAEVLGISESAARIKKERTKNVADDLLIAEKFGSKIADTFDVDKIAKSKGMQSAVDDKIKKSQGILKSVLKSETLAIIGGPASIVTNALAKLYYSAEDKKRLFIESQKHRQTKLEELTAKIAQDRKKMLEDVKGASVRKQNSIRDHSLERERISRQMQTARF